MEKKCPKCGEVKDQSQFRTSVSRKSGLQSYCIICDKEKQRLHYLQNKERYIKKSHETARRKANWWKQYKKTLKCNRCPESHPACLQFHHVDPSKKEVAISKVVRFWSIKRIMQELEKCEVICSNCHFKEHWIDIPDDS